MSGPVTAPLRMQTNDGSVDGIPINTIKVTNGDLSISGSVASLDTSGSGGGAFSFDLAGDAGSTQTVNNGATMTLQGGSSGADLKFTMSATNTATLDLQNTTVTPGSYTLASITVDAKGRITAASSGSVSVPSGANPSATVSGTAVNGSATTFMRSDAAPALADTAVTPGGYTYSSITVDQQGRLTSASSGTPPAVDGSGASTQVTYWQDSDTITGSSNMTFDGTNLSVSGYVKGGNIRIGDGTGEIETDDANDLVFKTNTGTNSGTLTLKNGTNGNLIFDPNGSGLLQIEGTTNPGSIKLMCEAGSHGITIQSPPHSASATYTFKMPTSMGSDGQVLTTDGVDQTSWTTVSGGGSPGGSDTQVQYNNGGSFGGMASMTFDDTAGAEQILMSDSSTSALVKIVQTGSGNAFEVHDQATDTSIFHISNSGKVAIGTNFFGNDNLYVSGSMFCDRYRAGGQSAGAPSFSYSGQTSGMFFATDILGLSVAGSEKIRITTNGEIGIGGANYGTSGQVLTSGGAGSAVSWTTPSGGSSGPPLSGVTYPAGLNWFGSASFKSFRINALPPYGIKAITTGSYTSSTDYDGTFYFPFYAPQSGTVDSISFNVTSAASDGTLSVGVYSAGSGTNQYPATLLGKGDVSITSGGNKSISSFVDGSGSSVTPSVTQGTLYYIGYARTTSGEAFSAYASNDGNAPNSGISLGQAESYVSLGGIIRSYATETSLPASINGGSPTWDDFTVGNASWRRIIFNMTIGV